MKTWLLTLFLGCFALLLPAQQDAKQALMHTVETSDQDTVRMKALIQLANLSKSEPEVRKHYIEQLQKEAEQSQNSFYLCTAYLNHIYICYNNNHLDELRQWLDRLNPLARKHQYYDIMFLGQQTLIDLLSIHEADEELLKRASAMLNEAQELNNPTGIAMGYACMGRAYRGMNRMDRSVEMYEKAFYLTRDLNNFQLSLEVTLALTNTYSNLDDRANWYKWLTIEERLLKQEVVVRPEKKESLTGDFMMLYVAYVQYYLNENDLVKAERYLKKATLYHLGKYYLHNIYYYDACSSFNTAAERWEQALVCLDKLSEIYLKTEYSYYLSAQIRKANVLTKLNRWNEAVELYETSLAQSDSLTMTRYNKDIDFLKGSYQQEQLMLKADQLHNRQILSFLVLTIIVLILLILFSFYYIRTSIKLRRAENQTRRIAEEEIHANRVKEAFLSNINQAISIPLTEVVNQSRVLTDHPDLSVQEKARASETIVHTSKSLMKLINNVLDLSRLGSGKIKYNVEYLNPFLCVHTAVELASSNYEIRQSHWGESEDQTPTIRFDQSRLFQVLEAVLQPSNESGKTLSVMWEVNRDTSSFVVTVKGSILSDNEQSQDNIIRNEMNRMFIELFGGRYEVCRDRIRFSIPLATPPQTDEYSIR